jgi:predicted phosphodiesterase
MHSLLLLLQLLSLPISINTEMMAIKKSILNVQFSQIITACTRIKCYCLSDLHADSERNQVWVKENCIRRDEDKDVFTVFIIPGDVGSEVDRLERVFKTVAANYDAVVYVPGNHEAWRRGIAAGGSATLPEDRAENREAVDSVVKLQEVMDKARDCGVFVGPLRIETKPVEEASISKSVTVFPLLSWYHAGWDKEPELTHPDYLAVEEVMPFTRKWGDFSMCSWGDIVPQSDFCSTSNDSTILAEKFAEINEPFLYENVNSHETTSPIVKSDDTIISFSHFLPRQELCPEKRFLLEPLLAKVVGSNFLEAQIRRLQPHLHLFGHTHIPIDLELEGIRYIQWPKGYFREADKQCAAMHRIGPLLVFDSDLGQGTSGIPPNSPSLEASWTKYYQNNKRNPLNVQDLAPWVLQRLDGFSGFVRSRKNNQDLKD